MDLSFTPEQEAFRLEVRSFLADNLPAEYARKVDLGGEMSKAETEAWQAILNKQGWLVPSWPVERGGTGWGTVEKFIFEEEFARANAPRMVPFGFSMLAPVLLKFGTAAQCDRWLPRMLNGDDWWCQGYSEPGAGSDLAALKCAAVRDGDDYVINGQKTWTTLGQHANMIFCLVRTSTAGKRQEGISFLLVDMATPGVEVRPIKLLEGGHEVNEIFFTDVRVPAENLVGEENKGWTYAKYLLTHERTNGAGVGESMNRLEVLKNITRNQAKNGKPLIEDPLFAARIAKVEIRLRNLETTNLRVLADVVAGGAPIVESSMLKLVGTEIRQEIDSLTRRAVGRSARAFVPETIEPGYNGDPIVPDYAVMAAANYFNNRKITIFAGSSEVQKNIITKLSLGL